MASSHRSAVGSAARLSHLRGSKLITTIIAAVSEPCTLLSMSLTADDVLHIARLARITTPEDVERLTASEHLDHYGARRRPHGRRRPTAHHSLLLTSCATTVAPSLRARKCWRTPTEGYFRSGRSSNERSLELSATRPEKLRARVHPVGSRNPCSTASAVEPSIMPTSPHRGRASSRRAKPTPGTRWGQPPAYRHPGRVKDLIVTKGVRTRRFAILENFVRPTTATSTSSSGKRER
jgi:hypothetical protein